MKFLIRISFLLSILVISSCELTDLDLQENPNASTPDKAELGFVFNAAQVNFGYHTWRVSNISMPIVRMTAMTGGNTYDNQYTGVSFNGIWNNAYGSVIPDLDLIIANAEGEVPAYSGAAKIMKAYTMMSMVDLFGDVPFDASNKGVEDLNPAPQSAQSVYEACLALLQAGVADMSDPNAAFPTTDVYYGGDVSKWIAAANSLMLRYHITTRLVNGGAKDAIEKLVTDGVITDAANDFDFQFDAQRAIPDARHPDYSNNYEVDANSYMSNYYMWSLLDEKGIQDPRLRYYFYRQDCDTTDEDQFTLDCPTTPRPNHYTGDYPWCVASEDGWWGRDHGNNDGIPPDGLKRTTYGVYPAGGKFDADDCAGVTGEGADGLKGAGIMPIMDAAFVYFMRAEAALTLGTSDDARAMLEEGIRTSIGKVMDFGASQASADYTPTAEDVDEYVNITLASYDGAADDAARMDIVAKEYHIALFGNGLEAYNMYRRTGYPSNMQPTRQEASGTFPRLFFYAADHINLNLNAPAQRDLSEQVYWDTNPAGFIN